VEPYVEVNRRGTDTRPETVVPDDHYVMLGDNRTQSCDSRTWGPAPRENLVGRVFAVYWPPGRISIR
jgi:signal peptidase I